MESIFLQILQFMDLLGFLQLHNSAHEQYIYICYSFYKIGSTKEELSLKAIFFDMSQSVRHSRFEFSSTKDQHFQIRIYHYALTRQKTFLLTLALIQSTDRKKIKLPLSKLLVIPRIQKVFDACLMGVLTLTLS